MHELSIAHSLVEIACDQLNAAGWDRSRERVGTLHLKIGPLAGVVKEALDTAFSVASVGTDVQGAQLQVESTNLVVWCEACAREQVLSDTRQFECPQCGARTPKIVRGMELEILSIEVVDAAADPGSPSTDSETQR